MGNSSKLDPCQIDCPMARALQNCSHAVAPQRCECHRRHAEAMKLAGRHRELVGQETGATDHLALAQLHLLCRVHSQPKKNLPKFGLVAVHQNFDLLARTIGPVQRLHSAIRAPASEATGFDSPSRLAPTSVVTTVGRRSCHQPNATVALQLSC